MRSRDRLDENGLSPSEHARSSEPRGVKFPTKTGPCGVGTHTYTIDHWLGVGLGRGTGPRDLAAIEDREVSRAEFARATQEQRFEPMAPGSTGRCCTASGISLGALNPCFTSGGRVLPGVAGDLIPALPARSFVPFLWKSGKTPARGRGTVMGWSGHSAHFEHR